MPAGQPELYAGVSDIAVEVQEFSTGGGRVPVNVWPYAKADLPAGTVKCSNTFCGRGRVNVDAVISRAVGERLTRHVERHACGGFEGSPKGRRRYRDCLHVFVVTVRVEYQE